MRRNQLIVGSLISLVTMVVAAGCYETICGPGTVLRQGECVPLQQINCSGPGVSFQNGRCVANYNEICGDNTQLSADGRSCVGIGGSGPVTDAGTDPVSDVSDITEEVNLYEPECGTNLVAGQQVCAWGRAVSFIDLAPLPGDTASPPLQVQFRDLILALTMPATHLLGEGAIGENGWWIIPSFDLQESPPRQVIVFVGEEEDTMPESVGTVWQRSISGLVQTSAAAAEYANMTVYGVPRAAVEGWYTELGTNLDASGFVLIRMAEVDDDGNVSPMQGATLQYGGSGAVQIHYFADAEMTTFKSGDNNTTGPSGAAMLVPGAGSSALDRCSASRAGFSPMADTACGASAGRTSLTWVYLTAE